MSSGEDDDEEELHLSVVLICMILNLITLALSSYQLYVHKRRGFYEATNSLFLITALTSALRIIDTLMVYASSGDPLWVWVGNDLMLRLVVVLLLQWFAYYGYLLLSTAVKTHKLNFDPKKKLRPLFLVLASFQFLPWILSATMAWFHPYAGCVLYYIPLAIYCVTLMALVFKSYRIIAAALSVIGGGKVETINKLWHKVTVILFSPGVGVLYCIYKTMGCSDFDIQFQALPTSTTRDYLLKHGMLWIVTTLPVLKFWHKPDNAVASSRYVPTKASSRSRRSIVKYDKVSSVNTTPPPPDAVATGGWAAPEAKM